MINKNKILSLLLVGTMLLCSCGRDKVQSGGYEMQKQTIPTYLDQEGKFTIGVGVGIPEFKTVLDQNNLPTAQKVAWTDEEFQKQYQMIKNAGFTFSSTPIGTWSENHTVRLLESADKVGIDQLICDPKLNAILEDDKITDQEAVEKATEILSNYTNFKSFCGLTITDEPSIDKYSALRLSAKRYKTLAQDINLKDKIYFLNLFPFGATSNQLGTTSYEKYLEEYETLGLDYVCYDKYPLFKGTDDTTYLSEDFLYNMQLCQDMKSNPEVWTYLQSMGFGINKDPDCVEDFRIQANCALSYGLNGIRWFCYFTPLIGGPEGFTSAIINMDGTPTPKYDMVKKVNLEIQSLAGIYNNFTWERTINLLGSSNLRGENLAFNYFDNNDTSHRRIKSFCAVNDVIAGVFVDDEGRDGFMVTNYDLPSSKQINQVDLEFYNCTKAIVVINGEKSIVDTQNGKLTLYLKASEGAFIIPLYL